jgi:hypothetical protein
MPRRRAIEVTRESDADMEDGVEEQLDASFGGEMPTSEVLLERAREFIQLNREITEINAQLKLVRKSLKGIEQSLINGMVLTKTEQVECEGVVISRSKTLKITTD